MRGQIVPLQQRAMRQPSHMEPALLATLWLCAATSAGARPTVAVVGAGIGGAATAYRMASVRLGPDLPDIHVFERSQQVGGREAEFRLDGLVHELGASIFHASNMYAYNLTRAMNLTPVEPSDEGGGGGGFALWDGARFRLRVTGQPLLDAWRIGSRYGLAMMRYGQLARRACAAFGSAYDLQARGMAFATPGELLAAMGGLDAHTRISAAEYMQAHLRGLWGLGAAAFTGELAGAINRVNYNQGNRQLNALAGLVSYIPAATPRVFKVAEGNSALAARLLKASGATLHTGCSVAAVAPTPEGRWRVSAAAEAGGSCGGGDGSSRAPVDREFDLVLTATPLELTNISFPGLPIQPSARKFQSTVTTFVLGDLSPAYFQVSPGDMPEGDVFVTNDAPTPWSSIARQPRRPPSAEGGRCGAAAAAGADARPLWKVFSTDPLPPALLGSLFLNASVVAERAWLAYPRYNPPEELAPFELAPGLYYANGLEGGASAQEVSLVAATNNVLLAAQRWQAARAGSERPAAAAAARGGARAVPEGEEVGLEAGGGGPAGDAPAALVEQ